MKKLLAAILMLSVVFGMSMTMTGCGDKKAETPVKKGT